MNNPKYRPGFPLITDEKHKLWLAQQADWTDHLPHEAWAEMEADPRRADSRDHPAFAAGYAPNFYASSEKQSEEPLPPRQRANRR